MHYCYITNFPKIGSVEIISDGTAICGLRPVSETSTYLSSSENKKLPRIIEQCIEELNAYFSGENKKFSFPISQQGTKFQQAVWTELTKIPYGETISYAELAKRIGNPKAVRAVGTANGRNKIFIVVPCHRVIMANGDLGGYAMGTDVKRFLIDLEKKHT